MKIVYIISSIRKMSGIERMFVSQINYLANHFGYDVTILTYEQGDAPFIYNVSSRVKHVDYNVKMFKSYKFSLLRRIFVLSKWQLGLWKRMRVTIKELRPDIVVCSSYSIAEMLFVLFLRRIKNVVQVHSNYYQSGGRLKRHNREGLLRRLYCRYVAFYIVVFLVRQFDKIVVLTKGDAAKWRSPQVCVIPNPVVVTSPIHNIQRKNKILAIGNLHLSKGFDLLLDAWSLIYQTHTDWELEITGQGEEENSLQEQILKMNQVRIVSPSIQIAERYQYGSIYVFSSRFEGFGLVLLEAMSFGLACVAFDCDFGPREIITDGEDGYLVPPGDVEALAERIDYLICHPEERERLGKNAVEKSKQFNIDKIMSKWHDLYESLAGKDL